MLPRGRCSKGTALGTLEKRRSEQLPSVTFGLLSPRNCARLPNPTLLLNHHLERVVESPRSPLTIRGEMDASTWELSLAARSSPLGT